MKNKSLKVIGLIGLAVIGMFALNRYHNKQKGAELFENGSNNATPELPLTITVIGESKDTSIVYIYDGKKYTKQVMSPLVRSMPVEITKSEFDLAYQKFLA